MLGHTDGPLWDRHDLVMLDLDGVVYIGRHAVEGAVDHLGAARVHLRLAFITNNASRTPTTVADHLTELGVEAEVGDVVTSAQAAGRVLVERLGTGARVAVLGAQALRDALEEVDLVPAAVDDDDVEALVTGYGPDVLWRDVMRAAVRIRDGVWWVASNTDLSIPTAYGSAPGHGVLVGTLQRFSGVDPVVAGKPARPLLEETVRRVGGERPLMVGDRLDTDIAGGRNADVDTLLVLTGVTGLAELVAAGPDERPTYISSDLSGLGARHPEPTQDGGSWLVGGWVVTASEDGLAVDGDGSTDDWWRAVACAAWTHLDDTGHPVSIAGVHPAVGSTS